MKIVLAIFVLTIYFVYIKCQEKELEIKYLTSQDSCEKKTKSGDYLSVHYRGKFENGTEFETSVGNKPYEFQLGVGQVIKGYDLGLLNMCEGDKRELTIPAHLAYGEQGNSKIPGGSTLIFEVELIKIHEDLIEMTVVKSVESCTKKSKSGDVLTVHYVYNSEDGTISDSSYKRDQPYEFTVGIGKVVRGYDLGLLDMCEGEKRKLIMPSHQPYGNIISEVELLTINSKTDL